jgi:hypothetical protein
MIKFSELTSDELAKLAESPFAGFRAHQVPSNWRDILAIHPIVLRSDSKTADGCAEDPNTCPKWPQCRCGLCSICGYQQHMAIHCGTSKHPNRPYGHVFKGKLPLP